MCTQHPALLCCNWTSDTSVEKLKFFTCLLGLTLHDIAARPKLLACSVSGYLGPRVWFMYQTGAIEAPASTMTSGCVSYVSSGSNAQFSNRFSSPASNPSVVFDSAFIDHWNRRWEFLSQHMKLSVETIAAHQDLLLTSLPDRLAPRWQLLSRIASEQADFKAEDHLTALATLSDQDFAQAFKADGELLGMWHSNKGAVGCTFCSQSRKRSMCQHDILTYVKFEGSLYSESVIAVSLTFGVVCSASSVHRFVAAGDKDAVVR